MAPPPPPPEEAPAVEPDLAMAGMASPRRTYMDCDMRPWTLVDEVERLAPPISVDESARGSIIRGVELPKA